MANWKQSVLCNSVWFVELYIPNPALVASYETLKDSNYTYTCTVEQSAMPSASTHGIYLRHSVSSYTTELTPDEVASIWGNNYGKFALYPNQ